MEKKSPKPMTPFDEMVTPPHLQMLKVFLPYTPASNQKFLGIFIKFMEFQQTIHFFQSFNIPLHSQTLGPDSSADMFEDLKPYLPPQTAEMADTFMNMMNMMEMMQMFQENAPDDAQSESSSSGAFSGGFNPMDMMKGMLTPEQQNMFEMYNTMFSNEADMTKMEGDDLDERMDEPSGNEEP